MTRGTHRIQISKEKHPGTRVVGESFAVFIPKKGAEPLNTWCTFLYLPGEQANQVALMPQSSTQNTRNRHLIQKQSFIESSQQQQASVIPLSTP